MTTIKERYQAVLNTYGRTAHGDAPAALRELMLAVHYESCEATGRTASGKGWRRRECGKDGWLCGRAKAIRDV